MHIIEKSRTETKTAYSLTFDDLESPGAGWGFDCDEGGNLFPMNYLAWANYEKCLAGVKNGIISVRGVHLAHTTVRHNAIGRCACGASVELAAFTNTCDKCGADYNMSGSRLAPREQWGEETGEHWSECY